MRTWKQRAGACVFGAVLVGLLAGAGASAAPAEEPAGANQARIAPGTVSVVTIVRARDLMSAADRQLYRQQIRDARDLPARQRVQAEWLGRLQARAAEHGVVMVIETRTLPPEWRRIQTRGAPTGAAASGPVVVVRPVEPMAPPPPRVP